MPIRTVVLVLAMAAASSTATAAGTSGTVAGVVNPAAPAGPARAGIRSLTRSPRATSLATRSSSTTSASVKRGKKKVVVQADLPTSTSDPVMRVINNEMEGLPLDPSEKGPPPA